MSMLGRAGELEALESAISQGARIVTLYGPAGVGKTTLAKAFAAKQTELPAIAVDLRPIGTLGELQATVAEALQIPLDPGGDLSLALQDKGPLLLLLDNFDGLAEVAAELIERWGRSGGLVLLLTSREAVGIAAERALPLAPLREEEAVALFLRGARRVRPGFAEDAEVPSLVRALDGLPLAIELASAWCDGLPLSAIAKEIGSLSLLEPLAAALESSVRRLPSEVRATLEGCAIFCGPFSLEDAQAVLGPDAALPRALATLVKKCLLEVEFGPHGARYGFLSVVRAFAARAVPAALRARHAQHFAERNADGASQLPDLLSAFDHSSDPLLRCRLALLLDPILYDRGPFERHLPILERALSDASGALEAELLHARARARRVRGQTAQAWADLTRARELAAPELAPRIVRMMGVIARHREALDEAEALLREAIGLARGRGDEACLLRAADDLGVVLLDRGDLVGAERSITQALELAMKLGDRRYQGIAEQHLGLRFHLDGALAQAEEHYRRALDRLVAVGDRRFEGWTLGMSAYLALEDGRLEEAEARAAKALLIYRSIQDPRTRAFLLPPKLAAMAARGAREEAKAGLLQAYEGLDPAEDRAPICALQTLEAQLSGASAPLPPGPIEVQMVARLCAALGSQAQVRIAPDARWFEAAHLPRVSLVRRPPLRRVLARLLRQHQEAPGQGLSWERLLEAGWPGEQVLPSAGARRVYVAIATLRKMGLGSRIVRVAEGYALDGRSALVAAEAGSLTKV